MPITIETIYVNINFNVPGATDAYLTKNLFYYPQIQKK